MAQPLLRLPLCVWPLFYRLIDRISGLHRRNGLNSVKGYVFLKKEQNDTLLGIARPLLRLPLRVWRLFYRFIDCTSCLHRPIGQNSIGGYVFLTKD